MSSIHAILIVLLVQLKTYLNDKPCRVFAPPFDVRLPESDEADNDIETVVQPDILQKKRYIVLL